MVYNNNNNKRLQPKEPEEGLGHGTDTLISGTQESINKFLYDSCEYIICLCFSLNFFFTYDFQVSNINLCNKAWCKKYCISWVWSFAGELFRCYIGSSLHASGIQAQFNDSYSCHLSAGFAFPGMVIRTSKLYQGNG
ncbi:uncharacterized protein LOC122065581 [Macadamia integrifolia]|uniref:uncharacterized protein LOC122065581 n=1 Tax=Macadamia integrifolia TaxID=60698 RepID=UPI001C4EB453|nr:uncharacterized protein LOC122065581 [Macadamia integrifolia]